jgi:hypothetical protein
MSEFTQKLLLKGDRDSLDRMRRFMDLRAKADADDPALKKDDSPMNAEETSAFNIIARRMKQNMVQESLMNSEQANAMMDEWLTLLGKKGLLNVFVEESLIMGVPYKAYVLEFIAGLALFICTSNFIVLFFAMPVLHSCLYLIHQKRSASLRKEKIQKILSEPV